MSMFVSSIFFILIPISLALAGWSVGRKQTRSQGRRLVRLSFLLIGLFAVGVLTHWRLPTPPATQQYISTTNLSFIMLALVLFMGTILMTFSRNYMATEPRLNVYWRWLLLTLAAVSLVVMSNHLVLFWLGWVSISLALHKLLTFYPERPRAALAAHKKFLLARTAELCLFVAFVLLYQAHNTFFIHELVSAFNQQANNTDQSLTTYEYIAAILIAIVALIKCAQLPVHGWLIQVVEAPTPVSALLHAGVINLGGFLLILFGPLLLQVPDAQWLVLIVAGLTTVISALIMTTRISLKVRLAWSTSAQMGLMLLECALGLFELALLHLVTHSVYKAHAFLNSGNAIHEDIQRRLAPPQAPSVGDWLLAAILSAGLVIAAAYAIHYQGVWSPWVLFGLALTVLIAQRHGQQRKASLLSAIGLTLLLLTLYSTMKAFFGLILPINPALRVDAFSLADIWVMGLFISLFVLSWLLRYQAQRPAIQHLSMALFAGLYLDEWLTRLTLKVWPLRLPTRINSKTLTQQTSIK
jgi:NAD(P)H-quinone oxidoreductase subunit 5